MLSSRSHSQTDQTVENVQAKSLAAEGRFQRIEEEQRELKPELHKLEPEEEKEAEVGSTFGAQYAVDANEEARGTENPNPVKSVSSIALSTIPPIELSQVDVSGELLPGEMSMIFCGGRPEIQIENPTNSTRPLAFNIEWMEESQVGKSQGNTSVHIVEAESIVGEVTYPLDGRSVICISQGVQIARITIR
ncbi:hypothetical protein CkaCkLH20_02550 [Colletotrichum karsti]|uniref:Uncharacterized protein n=1 Tax=Colletotrichum karsti TaxID=1095194 RepID=A0A9P6IBF2_9PEZI|nr:uncharacterized protein CkaCkLH20_02550 [Colletotrichum karsti]KAF9879739.1 hypothetical protein CkaCkLH20_02550 [Colletotrichum karsti]